MTITIVVFVCVRFPRYRVSGARSTATAATALRTLQFSSGRFDDGRWKLFDFGFFFSDKFLFSFHFLSFSSPSPIRREVYTEQFVCLLKGKTKNFSTGTTNHDRFTRRLVSHRTTGHRHRHLEHSVPLEVLYGLRDADAEEPLAAQQQPSSSSSSRALAKKGSVNAIDSNLTWFWFWFWLGWVVVVVRVYCKTNGAGRQR
jgi:hypothetical protein